MPKENHRPFSLPLYIVAFVVAVLIFIIGIYVGTIIDKTHLSNISVDVDKNLQRLESTQLLFFLDDSPSFCTVLNSELEKLETDTEKIGQKLDLLADKGSSDPELKKQYFVLEAQSYLLSKKINDRCNVKDVLVLYFYSNNNCEKCRQQGEELLRARDQIGSHPNRIKFYSFDGDLDSPVADALKQKYNATSYPTIVVNQKLFEGYKDLDSLIKILKP